ncbi:MAG: hypothetical protein DMF91_20795, partial [Acidobacteria bacterium]
MGSDPQFTTSFCRSSRPGPVDLPEDLAFWNEVSATAETCLGGDCPRYDECFVTRMRQRAASSDLVIVNHHLLCADAAVRQNAYGEVIPACSHAVLDEAHQLEDVATQYFGFSVSTYRLEELARDIERSLLIIVGDDRKAKDDVMKSIERLRDHARAFFQELARTHKTSGARNEERIRATPESLAEAGEAAAHLTGALDIVESTLALVRLKPDTTREPDTTRRLKPDTTREPDATSGDEADEVAEDIAALARRAGELRDVQAIAEMAIDYPIFVQGTAPRSQLLKQFRETPHAVLLATSSFWQGVDVIGDALSCVIIDKLPFASPADPITAARI